MNLERIKETLAVWIEANSKWVFSFWAMMFLGSIILYPYQPEFSGWLKILCLPILFIVLVLGHESIFFKLLNEKIAVLVFGAVFLGFGINLVLEYFAIGYNFYDTGFITNPVFNLIQGFGYYNSELEMSEFGDHFNPGLILLAPFLVLFKNPIVAPVIKWLLFGLSFFAFKKLLNSLVVKDPFKSVLLIFWALNIGTINYMGFEVQASNLMIPFIFFSCQNIIEKKWVRLFFNLLFIFSLKENGSLVIFSLGLLSFFILGYYRIGIFISLIGLFFLFLIPNYVMPFLSGGMYIHQGILDPFCCLPDKAWFVGQVILCSGGFLLFFPEAFPVLGASLLASLLINRPGAHTLTFHYQDIPIAISFCVLSILTCRNKGFLPTFLSSRLNWRILYAIVFCSSIFFIRFTVNYYFEFNQVTFETIKGISEISQFQKEFDGKSKLWVQTALGFNLSSIPSVKCIMDGSTALNDTSSNYIILAPSASGRWPIEADYDAIIQRLDKEVEEGKRQKLPGYQSLLIYKMN